MKKLKTRKTKFALLLLIMIGGVVPVLWMQEGCQGNYPVVTAMVVTSTPTLPPDFISNFNSGSVSVNSTLLNTGGYPGYFSGSTYGGSTNNASPTPTVVGKTNAIASGVSLLAPNPGDGNAYAIHIAAPLFAVGGYEADQLNCVLSTNPNTHLYNASSFTGIQFSYYLASDDTNSPTARLLGVPLDLDTPPPPNGNGICTANCFNPHVVTLPSTPTNTWVTLTYTWSQFARPGFVPTAYQYSPLSNYLSEVLELQWSFASGQQGSAAGPVSTYTDVWIDNVKFLP